MTLTASPVRMPARLSTHNPTYLLASGCEARVTIACMMALAPWQVLACIPAACDMVPCSPQESRRCSRPTLLARPLGQSDQGC